MIGDSNIAAIKEQGGLGERRGRERNREEGGGGGGGQRARV